MIIYSIIPHEFIFKEYVKKESKFIEVEYMGEKVEVSPLSNNQFVINKLISSSPESFLNPQFQPGTVITGLEIGDQD